MDYAMVTSMTQLGVKEFGERRLQFIPTACYAYTRHVMLTQLLKTLFGRRSIRMGYSVAF